MVTPAHGLNYIALRSCARSGGCANSRRTNAERGFGLIEIIVVMVIIGVILAIVANPIRGAQRDGQRRQVVETAKSMAEAVDRFRLDHGERPPRFGSADWPTAGNGPRNSLSGTTYLRSAPEAIQDGLVTVGTTSSSATWRLVYRGTTAAPHGFRIDVIHRGSTAGFSCTITFDAAPPSVVPGGGGLNPC